MLSNFIIIRFEYVTVIAFFSNSRSEDANPISKSLYNIFSEYLAIMFASLESLITCLLYTSHILQAGRFTPTGGNIQDVHYIFIQDNLETFKKMIWDGLNTIPVSYTHLDVYKRQLLHKTNLLT